ncbi:ScbA/BarX family gamma-butyrolactone biosynthesis protein [Streptomyces sp. NPDC006235]|uniref:ScbA/BarX family gamma-butyrolactone biosynthesis protein n=1 Tax=Streptomyces sp. NPDC006235 TaxID=3156736 RepID=UPI0033BBE7EA
MLVRSTATRPEQSCAQLGIQDGDRHPVVAVTKESAHRARDLDVFPTRWARAGDDRFSVTVELPPDHPFFTPVGTGSVDPLMFVEAMRQCVLVVSHGAYGVPLGHHFLLKTLEFDCDARRLRASGEPTRLDVDVTFRDLKFRAGRLVSLRSRLSARRGGHRVGGATGHITLISPEVYRRIRREPLEAPVVPDLSPPVLPVESVGRTSVPDVVLSPTPQPGVWQLRVDVTHPTLFQRPNDHVPGMLLLEAARQAGAGLSAPRPFVPASGRIEFQRYAEFGSPCLVAARRTAPDLPGGPSVEVTGHQDGELVFHCSVTAAAEGSGDGDVR